MRDAGCALRPAYRFSPPRRQHGSPGSVAAGSWIDWIEAGEEPAVWQHLALGMGHAPPGTQPLEQQRREYGVAILAALALLNTQRHAFAVDITTFSETTSLARSPAP